MQKIMLTPIEEGLEYIKDICDVQLKNENHMLNEKTLTYIQIVNKINEIFDYIYELKIKE